MIIQAFEGKHFLFYCHRFLRFRHQFATVVHSEHFLRVHSSYITFKNHTISGSGFTHSDTLTRNCVSPASMASIVSLISSLLPDRTFGKTTENKKETDAMYVFN